MNTAIFASSPRSPFKRNSLPPTSSPAMSSSPPKSCLKRNSFPSSPRPLFLDGPRSASPGPVFDTDSESTASDSASQESYSTPTQRSRAKSVSFCEDDDVRVFYPITDPLHRQARKQVVRLFKACAEALKIDHPNPPPASRHSYSGYSECVLEGDEEER